MEFTFMLDVAFLNRTNYGVLGFEEADEFHLSPVSFQCACV